MQWKKKESGEGSYGTILTQPDEASSQLSAYHRLEVLAVRFAVEEEREWGGEGRGEGGGGRGGFCWMGVCSGPTLLRLVGFILSTAEAIMCCALLGVVVWCGWIDVPYVPVLHVFSEDVLTVLGAV